MIVCSMHPQGSGAAGAGLPDPAAEAVPYDRRLVRLHLHRQLHAGLLGLK